MENTRLPESDGCTIAEEVEMATSAFEQVGLRVDPSRGVGLAIGLGGSMVHRLATSEARRAEDWQEAPTKAEWKDVAKVYAQRRRAGESTEALSVLAEGLRASGSKVAQKALEQNAHEVAANGGETQSEKAERSGEKVEGARAETDGEEGAALPERERAVEAAATPKAKAEKAKGGDSKGKESKGKASEKAKRPSRHK